MPEIENTNRNYVKQMLALGKSSQRQASRKLWGIDMEGVLLPFMIASNAQGDSTIPSDALGAPLRLVDAGDGTAKFTKPNSEGVSRPIVRVAKPISDHVKLMREGYIATLMQYTATAQTEAADKVKAVVEDAVKAGAPIIARDAQLLRKATEAQMEAAADAAEAQMEAAADAAEASQSAHADTPAETREPVTANT